MNTKVKGLMLALSAVVLMAGGYAAGRISAPVKGEAEVVAVAAAPEAAQRPVRDSGDALALAKALSEVEALKAERAELQRALAAQQAAQASGEQVAQAAPRRRTWKEMTEEMKREDPERFKQMEERRAQMERFFQEAKAKRDDFLGSVDVALFTEEQRETHEQFMNELARQEGLRQQIQAAVENGEEISEALRENMWDASRRLTELREAERTALLGAVATSMGLSEAESVEFAQLMTEVYDATNDRARLGPGRGGRMPGGPGGGERPPMP